MVCRTQREQPELVRVVRAADGRVEVDISRTIDGRGAYLCPEADCLQASDSRARLARALRTRIPDDITETLNQHDRLVRTSTDDVTRRTITHGGPHGA